MAPALPEVDAWLARVRHDLVKRLVWPARDRRDAGGVPAAGELRPRLIDDEGRPVGAGALWAALLADAPAGVDGAEFQRALGAAEAAAEAGDVTGVLALEPAFDRLAASARALAPSVMARSVMARSVKDE